MNGVFIEGMDAPRSCSECYIREKNSCPLLKTDVSDWGKLLKCPITEREPTTQPEQRWIPVTERLPEDGTEVWVTTEMLSDVTRARWHKDSNLWCHPYYSDCLLVLRPIAWMEMSFPEPYKGGDSSDVCQ